MLLSLGYRAVIEGEAEFFVARLRRNSAADRETGQAKPPRDGNPFAKLKELNFA